MALRFYSFSSSNNRYMSAFRMHHISKKFNTIPVTIEQKFPLWARFHHILHIKEVLDCFRLDRLLLLLVLLVLVLVLLLCVCVCVCVCVCALIY